MSQIDQNWIRELKPGIMKFVDSMQQNNYSYINYSQTGDILDSSEHWGLANTVFAIKILYMVRALEDLPQTARDSMKSFIDSFAANKGYYYDPFVSGLSLKQTLKGLLDKSANAKVIDTRRAETRQTFAALHLLGEKPAQAFTDLPKTKDDVTRYLDQFNWSKPWNAASHFSHLVFFLYQNSELFDHGSKQSKDLINHAVAYINRMQNPDGCWYVGENVSLAQKINGAMKILTGLHAAGIFEIENAKQLIDTALSGINDEEACSNFNIVYVLYGATRVEPKYRRSEIEQFLINRLELYHKFYRPETGGFSFHKNKANDVYYGKKITKGLNEADIHGTTMFTWGITIVNQMLDLGIDWRVPLN